MPCVPAQEIIDCPLDFDSLRNLKSGLGTAAVIVMDKSTDIIRHRRLARTTSMNPAASAPPAGGTGWSNATRMADGRAESVRSMLLDVSYQIEGHTICALGDAAAWPVQGLIRHFRHVIEERIDRYSANADGHGAVSAKAAE